LLKNNKKLISIIYYIWDIALRTNILSQICSNIVKNEDAYYIVKLTLLEIELNIQDFTLFIAKNNLSRYIKLA